VVLKVAREKAGIDGLLDDCEVIPKDLEDCLDLLKEFAGPFVALLPRSELRSHGEDFVRGLLSDLERKSTEPIAERAGKYRRGLQRFMGESPWDHVPLLDELNRQVAAGIGSASGVLTLDSSSFPKKGEASVGVARQWCGRLGKIENCQTGVFLGYVTNLGHTLVDERLYLPKEWAKDRARRAMCHIPRGIRFKTAHELSLELLEARREQLPHGWINGDDAFGSVPWFRAELRGMGERYLLEIPGSLTVCAAEDPPKTGKGGRPRKAPFIRASRWKDGVGADAWVRIHIRDGVKGPLVVWAARARVRTRAKRRRDLAVEWLLVTRTESQTPEYRYYLSNAAADVALEEMVHAANARYWIEDCFERAKGRIGMDHYEVRSWAGWHHHMTLSLLALWFLVQEQRRLNASTPAITLQQSAEAIGELLRDPELDTRRLALKITRRLRRTELVRIAHWRKFKRLPPRWAEARSTHVAQ
jgi:SRSO17 transposase